MLFCVETALKRKIDGSVFVLFSLGVSLNLAFSRTLVRKIMQRVKNSFTAVSQQRGTLSYFVLHLYEKTEAPTQH